MLIYSTWIQCTVSNLSCDLMSIFCKCTPTLGGRCLLKLQPLLESGAMSYNEWHQNRHLFCPKPSEMLDCETVKVSWLRLGTKRSKLGLGTKKKTVRVSKNAECLP